MSKAIVCESFLIDNHVCVIFEVPAYHDTYAVHITRLGKNGKATVVHEEHGYETAGGARLAILMFLNAYYKTRGEK